MTRPPPSQSSTVIVIQNSSDSAFSFPFKLLIMDSEHGIKVMMDTLTRHGPVTRPDPGPASESP